MSENIIPIYSECQGIGCPRSPLDLGTQFLCKVCLSFLCHPCAENHVCACENADCGQPNCAICRGKDGYEPRVTEAERLLVAEDDIKRNRADLLMQARRLEVAEAAIRVLERSVVGLLHSQGLPGYIRGGS